MTPDGVRDLVARGHRVLVEKGAGLGSALPDSLYREAGADLVDAETAFHADLVVKVKEPQPDEYRFLDSGSVLFTYLHLAAAPELALELCRAQVTAIGYETVQLESGGLPLLAPMSEVAGRMAPQIGAHYLERHQGGRGVLLGGAPGVRPATVVVLGAGNVGYHAAWIAQGMEAEVILIDEDVNRLRYVDQIHRGRILTLAANRGALESAIPEADLLVGAVLHAGARAPRLVDSAMVAAMKPGSVIIDVSVDQGGCVETIHPTTHSEPVYERFGVLHYGVANMPGAVPHTSTFALANSTLAYVALLADHGLAGACRLRPELALGLNTHAGRLVNAAVADAVGMDAATFDPHSEPDRT
jgi:alanine dehydrogenase